MTERVSLVSGAASGNGRAIVGRLLGGGDRVAALDMDAAALAATAEADWASAGDRLLCVTADIAREIDVDTAVHACLRRFGRLDLLVNNAGITGGAEATILHETTAQAFDRVFAVNVRGMFLLSRAVLPGMLERGAGVIVNIASVAGLRAFPARAAYSASKGAAIQLSRSIAADYARRGVRCVALCPGMIDTPMTRWRLEQPPLRAEVLARIPQGEIGSADDVAAAVVFLASAEARYWNGAALVMDGGYSAV